MSLENSVFARNVNPYLNMLSFPSMFLILIGQTVSRNIPILYTKQKPLGLKQRVY